MKEEMISKDYAMYIIKYYQAMLSWDTKDKIEEIKRKIKEDKIHKISKYQQYINKNKVLSLINYYSTLKCLTEEKMFDYIKDMIYEME